MRQVLGQLLVKTRGRGFYEVTDQVANSLKKSGLNQGLATLHIRHTSASLVIQENADPSVREDFERFFARLVPEGDRIFSHNAEGDDDMPAHVRSALTATNLSIPFSDSQLLIGTWQGIFLWEHRTSGHNRQIAIHLLGE